MAKASVLSRAKLRLFERFFPDASEATVETVEILMDIEQMSTMLASFDDLRSGRIVSMKEAFADL